MKPLFHSVKIKRPKSNKFDLSYERKMSFNMGELIPMMVQEIVPGDKFKVSTEMLLRFAPMLAPIMHRVNVFTNFFFVPNRLVWSNWDTYITGGADGQQTATFPVLGLTNANKAEWAAGTLADYFGIPPNSGTFGGSTVNINALPFRAYQLIYNEYFRDQTLQTAVPITKNDTVLAAEQTALCTMRMRCWEKDYFTSALPWTQRGVVATVSGTPNYKTGSPIQFTFASTPTAGQNVIATASTNPTGLSTSGGGTINKIDNLNGVDINIMDLRRANRLQTWLERNALSGSRYIEQIAAHFGILSSDKRLQRPEYLGGGKMPVVVSEVVSSVKETTNPQGTMTGHGVTAGANNGFTKFFEEHGYVIGLVSVLPKTAYQQGIPRMFQKVDKFEFFWPELAHIGEQAIKNKELYWDPNAGEDNGTFGYTPRYAEYKFNMSSVHGDFRSTLNYWHMGRIFASAPGLNSAFLAADPTNRVFAVQDTSDHLWIQLYNQVTAVRPMPTFGEPIL